MLNKMLRKKAMEMAMKEAPSIAIAIKSKKMPEDMMTGKEESMDEEMTGKEEGFVQMAVTPEEKQMILKMRSQNEDSSDEESDKEMAAEKAYA